MTRGRISIASFRQKLDPIRKKDLRRQNPLELVFQDISTFDAENPIVRSLLRELDLGQKVSGNNLIKHTPGPPGQDFALRNRLNKLRDRQKPKNNNSNNISPPRSLSALPPPGRGPFIPPPPLYQPAPSVFYSFHPPPLRHDSSLVNFHIPAQLSSGNFGNRDQGLFGNLNTLTREKEKEKVVQDSVQKELGDTIYELPDPPKLELGDGLLNSLGAEADDILDQQFVNIKQQEDAVLEQIKEDYNFVEIKDVFDEGAVHDQLDFFYSGKRVNSIGLLNFYHQAMKIENLFHFYYLVRDRFNDK